MKYLISKQFRFEAAHKLPAHDGKCQRLHGHSFVMTVFIGADTLIQTGAKQGMVVDFGDVSRVVKPLLENKLDHFYLNESTGLVNPTSENLAKWIFDQLSYEQQVGKLNGLVAVEVEETCTSACRYEP